MTYTFAIENGAENFEELAPIYRTHYREMQERLSGEGITVGDFAMRLDVYMERWKAGHLINYVARKDGAAVGYGNFYLTNDMHNGEFIAVEDAIYVLPAHRNGTGRKLALFVLDDLRRRGCKRLTIQAVTDPRASLLWQRIGFKPTGQVMAYTFEDT